MSLSQIIVVPILVCCVASRNASAQTPSSRVSRSRTAHSSTSAPAPSPVVSISPTTLGTHSTSTSGDDQSLNLQGFDLRGLMVRVYGVSSARITLPPTVDASARYDVSVNPGKATGEAAMNMLLRQAIEDRFHLTAARVSRSTAVYVLSSVGNPPASSRVPSSPDDDNADIDRTSSTSVSFRAVASSGEAAASIRPGIGEMNGVSIQGATMGEFCQTLENDLDRPVVDETHLQGRFNLHLKSTSDKQNDLLEQLQSTMNLTIQASMRIVEMVVFQVC